MNENRLQPGRPLRVLAWVTFLMSSIYFMLHFQDDAFIHLRYARNLLDLQGVYYNVGQTSYGTSSPLYLYLLAALMGIGITTLWTTKAVSLAFHAVLVAQFLWMSSKAAGRTQWVLMAITLLLCMPMSARWLGNGMETSIIAVIATSAGLAVFRPDLLRWGGFQWFLVGFLGCTVRVEFFALFGIALVQLFASDCSHRKASMGGLLAGMALSMLQYVLVFGGLTPDTAIAKSSGFSLALGISTFLPTVISMVGNFASSTTLGMGMLIILIACGIQTVKNRYARNLLTLNWLGLLGLVFMISARGQAIQGVRYFVFIVFYFAGALLITPSPDASVSASAPGAARKRYPTTHWRWVVMASCAVFLMDAVLSWPVVNGRSRTTLAFLDLNMQTPDDTKCIGYDIGYFTYFTHCRIYDMAGLVNGRKSATLRTDERLHSFVGTKFDLAFVNEGQLATLEKFGVLSRADYDLVAANDFPNIGYWHSKDADRHMLLKRKVKPS